jgi:bacterioferritin-associated ferredoxin
MGEVVEVDRCFCHEKTFAALKQVAEISGASSLEELEEEVEFGDQCEICRSYVQKMLDTGETSFTSLITDA